MFTAEDTGGKIKGKQNNIYMETHEEATEFGIQRNLKAYILEEPQNLNKMNKIEGLSLSILFHTADKICFNYGSIYSPYFLLPGVSSKLSPGSST